MRISDLSSDVCSSDLRRMPDVLHHADPFMEHRPQQVEAAQLLDDAIADLFLAGFRLEGAQHPVPDDEHTGIVAVEIARVGGVVHARSEERRVGKECVSTCRSRWSPYH